MLASSLIDLHIEGGILFTFPLLLMLITNVCIIIYLLFTRIQKKQFNSKWLEAIKQIGGLAVAWGTWSTIYGLLQIFKAIESASETIPQEVIAGGLQVALITILYGILIFCISLLIYIILKLSYHKQADQSL